MTFRTIVAASAGALLLVGASGCGSGNSCDVTATRCPYQMYGTAAGNCLYGSPVWKECSDPQSICQGGDCSPNTNNTCTYGGSSVPSKFCCGGSTVTGSLDCPGNQTFDGKPGLFCGMTCQRPGSQCCNGGRCGAVGGVCPLECSGNTVAAGCPDGSEKCCSPNMVCCHDSANGGAIGCEFAGFCQ